MYCINDLSKLPKNGEGFPEAVTALGLEDNGAFADGAIPKKYKELIAITVALTRQCPSRVRAHWHEAVRAGATVQQLAETLKVAAALGAGRGITDTIRMKDRETNSGVDAQTDAWTIADCLFT